MAVAWASHNTSAWTSTASHVVTKPTGLAVGDVLLGIVNARKPAGQTINLPSGWTSIYSVTNASNGFTSQRAFYKVADASDVAAANFTFTISGAVDSSAVCARITGFGNINTFSATENNNTSSSPLTTTTVTPDRTDCLFILLAGGGQSGGASTPALSGYALTTDNPTWTEQFEINQVNAYTFALATATRSALTATGQADITLSTGPASGDYVVGLIVIAPQLDAVSTPAVIPNYNITFNLLSPVNNKMMVNTPTSSSMSMPVWTNPNKIGTDWTNPNK